jgi:hypothetical protein
MTSINRPSDYMDDRTTAVTVANYHDQVRWGPIVGGLVVALSTQLVLSALGAAVGLSSIGGSGAPRTEAPGVGLSVGIWAIISLLVSLFVGGWVASRTSGRIGRNTALLNGVILWASMLVLSAWLVSSGVTGAFGVAASNAGSVLAQAQQSNPGNVPGTPGQPTIPSTPPTITAQQTRDLAGNAAKVSWSFVLGALLGLAAALIGSATGFRHFRANAANIIDRD